jgi:hypothetical protein
MRTAPLLRETSYQYSADGVQHPEKESPKITDLRNAEIVY